MIDLATYIRKTAVEIPVLRTSEIGCRDPEDGFTGWTSVEVLVPAEETYSEDGPTIIVYDHQGQPLYTATIRRYIGTRHLAESKASALAAAAISREIASKRLLLQEAMDRMSRLDIEDVPADLNLTLTDPYHDPVWGERIDTGYDEAGETLGDPESED